MSQHDKDLLIAQMEAVLDRLDTERDLTIILENNRYEAGLTAEDLDLTDAQRDLLGDLGHTIVVGTDGNLVDFDIEAALEAATDRYEDVLSIEYEPGKPFCVALAIGGPDIYLVDMGGFGGPQLWGAWGERHVITSSRVDRHVDYFLDLVQMNY